MPSQSIQERLHPDHLLPWYVNQTLSFPEKKNVEDHLQQCCRCQNEVVFLRSLRQAVKSVPTQSPGNFGLNRLLHEVRMEKERPQRPQESQSSTWWKRFTIAASLIMFLQAGLLLDAWFFSNPLAPLAGPQEQGTVLQVSFVPTATEVQIRESLSVVHGTIVDGPSQLGLYRIRLNHLTLNNSDLEEAIERLRQQEGVIRHVAVD